MHRREFLKRSAALAALGLLPLGLGWWAMPGNGGGARRRLIVVMLRGAVDGLNVVVPHAERPYYEARPRIAIPRPGSADGALDLDGRFGLHPALASVMALWKEELLGFVHAAGSPDETRSHFDAQDYMESGTPGAKHTTDGWMNRLLGVLPGAHAPTQAVSLGPTVPKILSGPIAVANMPLGRAASRPMPLDRPRIGAAFDRLYEGHDPLCVAYQEGREARKMLLEDLDATMTEQKAADNGAPSPVGFAQDADQLARLIARDPSIQLAFLALGGWDTHVNQGASTGQLAGHLKPLGEGLYALVRGLEDALADTTILVMSEFGRTVKENGNGGTDHGHGNVMWVLGGQVRGGKVHGIWPGLEESERYEGRDLAVTTDFRAVIAEVLAGHLELDDRALTRVLPGFRMTERPGVLRT